MEWLAGLMVGFQGLAFGILLVILVYLIFRRSKVSKEERFEKRDN